MEATSTGPVYLKIYRCLKKRILTGQYPTNAYLPSERELSEEFSVERATVRRSLGLLVKDGLIEKIVGSGSIVRFGLDAAEDSYSRAPHSFTNLSFVVPGQSEYKIAEPFMSSLFDAVEAECRELGYNLFYTHVSDVGSIPPIITTRNVAAVIWVSNIPDSVLEFAYHNQIPSLVYGADCALFHNVLLDSVRGGQLATQHLIQSGHIKIATIAGLEDFSSTKDRLKGYSAACKKANLPLCPDYVVYGDWGFSGGYEAMQRLLNLEDPPTAVFAQNDMMALGAVKCAVDNGKQIPADLSVIGFDNIVQAEQAIPSLTTMGCPPSVIARQILANLPLHRNPDEECIPLKITIPVKLYERKSVAPPPGA